MPNIVLGHIGAMNPIGNLVKSMGFLFMMTFISILVYTIVYFT